MPLLSKISMITIMITKRKSPIVLWLNDGLNLELMTRLGLVLCAGS